MRRRLAAAALAAVLLATACTGGGGDDGREGDADGPTTSAPAPTSTTVAKPVGDKAKAEAMILKEADVGPGYAASVVDDPEYPENDEGLFRCTDEKGFFDPGDDAASAESDLAKDQNTSVTSFVKLAADEAAAAAAFAVLDGEPYLECTGAVGEKAARELAVTEGGKLADWSIEKRSVSAGDQAFAIQSITTITGSFRAQWHYDTVLLRKGRAFAGITFFTDGAPFPQAEKDRLVALVVERMTTLA